MKSTFLNDAFLAWNKAPVAIRNCKSLSMAKSLIKTFVKTLPVQRKCYKNANTNHDKKNLI